MFAVTQPPLLKINDPQANIEDLFKNFFFFFAATTSSLYLVKSQGFASSVSFNVIEMV